MADRPFMQDANAAVAPAMTKLLLFICSPLSVFQDGANTPLRRKGARTAMWFSQGSTRRETLLKVKVSTNLQLSRRAIGAADLAKV
jgi:hypothetical protein